MAIWSNQGKTPAIDVHRQRLAAGTVGGEHATPGSMSGAQVSGFVSVLDPRVAYGGTWTVSLVQSFEDYLGQTAVASTTGASISLTFSGTSVSIIGLNTLSGGYADVYIDGALQGGRLNTFTVLDLTTYGLGGLNSSDTTIHVSDTSAFPSSGSMIIDTEVITYSGKTATTFTGCVRTGTSSHISSAMVHAYGSLVNCYTPYHQSRATIWANNALQPGIHTLTLVVRSDKDASSLGNLLQINGFNIGGVLGASNLNTFLDYVKSAGIVFGANGVSTSTALPMFSYSTDQQILGVMACAAYSGSTYKPCFASYNALDGTFAFYCPSGASSTLDVVTTVIVLGAPL